MNTPARRLGIAAIATLRGVSANPRNPLDHECDRIRVQKRGAFCDPQTPGRRSETISVTISNGRLR